MHHTYPRDRLAAAKAGGGLWRDESEVALEAQVLLEAVNMRKRAGGARAMTHRRPAACAEVRGERQQLDACLTALPWQHCP